MTFLPTSSPASHHFPSSVIGKQTEAQRAGTCLRSSSKLSSDSWSAALCPPCQVCLCQTQDDSTSIHSLNKYLPSTGQCQTLGLQEGTKQTSSLLPGSSQPHPCRTVIGASWVMVRTSEDVGEVIDGFRWQSTVPPFQPSSARVGSLSKVQWGWWENVAVLGVQDLAFDYLFAARHCSGQA